MLSLGILVFLVLAAYHFRLIYLAGLLKQYILGYAIVILAFLIVALLFAQSYSLHLHHAFLPLVAWPATRFPNRAVSAVSQVSCTICRRQSLTA